MLCQKTATWDIAMTDKWMMVVERKDMDDECRGVRVTKLVISDERLYA